MRGWIYQLKSVGKDKFCILSFLLPVAVAVILHAAGSIDLSSLGEYHFGVVAGDMMPETKEWLYRYGEVTTYRTREELISAVREPSTNLIGVERDKDGIRTMIAGDELAIWQQAAGTLPALYEQRGKAAHAEVQILERSDILAGYQNIFIAMTLVTAMFMGCTFNAMNMISEKEDGVVFINEILPMSPGEYMLQKIVVGFSCGMLSALLTAAICFRLPPARTALMAALIVLSAFVSALVGLLVGSIAEGLMAGVVWIKIVMIVFMAVPLVYYLTGVEQGVLSFLCYLVPSSAAFEGIMDLAGGGIETVGRDMAILAAHGAGWFLLYLFTKKAAIYRKSRGIYTAILTYIVMICLV